MKAIITSTICKRYSDAYLSLRFKMWHFIIYKYPHLKEIATKEMLDLNYFYRPIVERILLWRW